MISDYLDKFKSIKKLDVQKAVRDSRLQFLKEHNLEGGVFKDYENASNEDLSNVLYNITGDEVFTDSQYDKAKQEIMEYNTSLYEQLLNEFKKEQIKKRLGKTLKVSKPLVVVAGVVITAASVIALKDIQNLWDEYIASHVNTVTGSLQGVQGNSTVIGSDVLATVMGGEYKITSGFGTPRVGHFHQGVDLRAAVGTPVHAAFSGTVIKVSNRGNASPGGNEVTVRSDDSNYVFTISHLSSIQAFVGEKVFAGEQIGLSGRSGAGGTLAPHVHFQVSQRQKNGTYTFINPAAFISDEGIDSTNTVLRNLGQSKYNPMSISATNKKWIGQTGVYRAGTGHLFAVFAAPYFGIKAGIQVVRAYKNKQRVINLYDFARMYVGAGGGDINQWVSTVSKYSGIAPYQTLDFDDESTVIALTAAIAKQESGSTLSRAFVRRVYDETYYKEKAAAQSKASIYNNRVVEKRTGTNVSSYLIRKGVSPHNKQFVVASQFKPKAIL